MKTKIALIIQLLVIICLTIFLFKGCQEKKQIANLYNASQGTLTKSINKLGQERSTRKLLVGTVSELKNLKNINDSTIKILQNTVDNNTISATILIDKTTIYGSKKSVVDTTHEQVVKINNKIYVYPTYSDSINSKWARGWIEANKDSIKWRFISFNEFDIKAEYKRDHFWTAKYPIVSVLNKNPHTETINMNSFVLDKDKSKQSRLVVFLEGVLVGTATYIILKK